MTRATRSCFLRSTPRAGGSPEGQGEPPGPPLRTSPTNVTELYLGGSEIPANVLRAAIRQGVLANAFTPVLCGASLRNMGVQPVLDAVVDFLPSPLDLPPAHGHHAKKNEDVEVPCKPEAFALGLVFKLQVNREAGNLCYVRLYSGKLKEGQTVYNISKKKRERINRLMRMHANHSQQLDQVEAGDIAVIIGLKTSQTGRHPRASKRSPSSWRRCTSPSRSSRWPSSPRPSRSGRSSGKPSKSLRWKTRHSP